MVATGAAGRPLVIRRRTFAKLLMPTLGGGVMEAIGAPRSVTMCVFGLKVRRSFMIVLCSAPTLRSIFSRRILYSKCDVCMGSLGPNSVNVLPRGKGEAYFIVCRWGARANEYFTSSALGVLGKNIRRGRSLFRGEGKISRRRGWIMIMPI